MARHLNLLPIERREHLRRGALLVSGVRIVRTILLGLGVMSAGAAMIGASLWGLTFTFASSGNMELERQVGEYMKLKELIRQQNLLLSTVDGLGRNRVIWSDYLSGFLAEVPPGTTINTLSADTTSGKVNFAGEALSRNALVVFEERLGQLEWVGSVTAPRQNLLQKDNPEYSFEIQLKQGQESGDVPDSEEEMML